MMELLQLLMMDCSPVMELTGVAFAVAQWELNDLGEDIQDLLCNARKILHLRILPFNRGVI